ncbi:hypothetical protein ACP70R_037383 [Stipagrostis hirtigluma subsp. patula]
MSVELPSLSSGVGSSSNGPPDGSGSGEQSDPDSRISELSEAIFDEIRSSTWAVSSSRAQTIYRVPKEKLQAADKGSYQPSYISFGPYYQGDAATEEMRHNERGKQFLLHLVVQSLQGPGRPGPSVVEQFMQAIAPMEARARSCYEGDIRMEWDAFCKMLLLDSVQLMKLLELLGRPQAAAAVGVVCPQDCKCVPCNTKAHDQSMTVHDLMMLENQIPFFVVEKVYDLCYAGVANGNGTRRPPIAELAWRTIQRIMEGVLTPTAFAGPPTTCDHLVQLCHVYLKSSCLCLPTSPLAGKYGRFRRATEYYEAGVNFRPWGTDDDPADKRRRPLLDVAFSGGVVRMAPQKVDERTGYLLRNVLAYEQRYLGWAARRDRSYVAAYVVFMSQLMGGPADVALLSRRGVVEHLLGSDGDVCALFQRLTDGLAFDPGSHHYLNPVGMALQAHCRSRLHRWRAWVVRHRFANPWLLAAWVFGALAVLGTIIQTVLAVLSYLKCTK